MRGDRLLDMGFINDIRRSFKLLAPEKRQNLLFSATYRRHSRFGRNGLLHDPL